MSTIKLTRAAAKAQIGKHPRSMEAMRLHLPAAVVKQCSSATLADMLDALWGACQEAKALAEREACEQGYIWDAKKGRSRDIAA